VGEMLLRQKICGTECFALRRGGRYREKNYNKDDVSIIIKVTASIEKRILGIRRAEKRDA
jgi:hypothetical protein